MSESEEIEQPPTLTISIPNLEEIKPPKGPGKIPTHIVLLTANDEEFLASYAYLKNVTRKYFEDLSWVYFGEIGEIIYFLLVLISLLLFKFFTSSICMFFFKTRSYHARDLLTKYENTVGCRGFYTAKQQSCYGLCNVSGSVSCYQ